MSQDKESHGGLRHRLLVTCLELLGQYDREGRYEARNAKVIDALSLAQHLGYQVGVRHDPAEPGWPVVYIELPTGQVSWHLPAHERGWDGHTSDEKYERIRAYKEMVDGQFPQTATE